MEVSRKRVSYSGSVYVPDETDACQWECDQLMRIESPSGEVRTAGELATSTHRRPERG